MLHLLKLIKRERKKNNAHLDFILYNFFFSYRSSDNKIYLFYPCFSPMIALDYLLELLHNFLLPFRTAQTKLTRFLFNLFQLNSKKNNKRINNDKNKNYKTSFRIHFFYSKSKKFFFILPFFLKKKCRTEL